MKKVQSNVDKVHNVFQRPMKSIIKAVSKLDFSDFKKKAYKQGNFHAICNR